MFVGLNLTTSSFLYQILYITTWFGKTIELRFFFFFGVGVSTTFGLAVAPPMHGSNILA